MGDGHERWHMTGSPSSINGSPHHPDHHNYTNHKNELIQRRHRRYIFLEKPFDSLLNQMSFFKSSSLTRSGCMDLNMLYIYVKVDYLDHSTQAAPSQRFLHNTQQDVYNLFYNWSALARIIHRGATLGIANKSEKTQVKIVFNWNTKRFSRCFCLQDTTTCFTEGLKSSCLYCSKQSTKCYVPLSLGIYPNGAYLNTKNELIHKIQT